MLVGRREYQTPRGQFVGYISADTWHFDGVWLRDWIYGPPASWGMAEWVQALIGGLGRRPLTPSIWPAGTAGLLVRGLSGLDPPWRTLRCVHQRPLGARSLPLPAHGRR